jgi:molybdate transport system permease protein
MAFISTLILLIIGTPIAWKLAQIKSKTKVLIEALLSLPLILPPTVLGFYLLLAFSPNSSFGQAFHQLTGKNLAFSFTGIVLGSVIYSLPFVIQPIQKAFEQLGQHYVEAAQVLGASKWTCFTQIVFPLTKASFITAACLGFAHTIGEFGVVLMIGGNIPGETRVLSIAIFEHVEALEYAQAHRLSIALLVGSFLLLSLLYLMNYRNQLADKQ